MKAEGSDNAREAFQFLALALGLVLALRLGYWGLEHWMSPASDDALGNAFAPFRAGYLIDPRTLVLSARPLLERLGIAVLLAIGCAAGFAVLAAGLARPLGGDQVKWSARSARWSLIIALPLLIIGALALPERSVHVDGEGFRLVERTWYSADLMDRSTLWPWHAVQGFTAAQHLPDGDGAGLLMKVSDGSTITLDLGEQVHMSDLDHLVAALEGQLRSRRTEQH